MRSSVRPWVTAGVAIVGASVLAVAPVEPLPNDPEPTSDVRIASSALELDVAPNPFEYYPQVLLRTLGNAGDRLDEYLAEPLPILTAIAQNQYTAFAEVINAAGSFDPVALAKAILRAVAQPVVNLVKVISSGEPFETAASLLVRLLPPIVSGVLAAGSATGDVIEALYDLDIVGVVSAMINIPARVVDGILNGRIDGVTDENLGLLTPVIDAPVADQITGPVAFLIDSLQDIGDTLSPPSTDSSPAGQLPDLAAPVVTITPVTPEKPAAHEDPAPQGPSADATPSGAPAHPSAEPEPPAPEPTAPSEPEETVPESDNADSDGPAGATVDPTAPTHERAAGDDPADDTDTGPSDAGGGAGPGNDDSGGAGDGG